MFVVSTANTITTTTNVATTTTDIEVFGATTTTTTASTAAITTTIETTTTNNVFVSSIPTTICSDPADMNSKFLNIHVTCNMIINVN